MWAPFSSYGVNHKYTPCAMPTKMKVSAILNQQLATATITFDESNCPDNLKVSAAIYV
jgi:hypothetical protein